MKILVVNISARVTYKLGFLINAALYKLFFSNNDITCYIQRCINSEQYLNDRKSWVFYTTIKDVVKNTVPKYYKGYDGYLLCPTKPY